MVVAQARRRAGQLFENGLGAAARDDGHAVGGHPTIVPPRTDNHGDTHRAGRWTGATSQASKTRASAETSEIGVGVTAMPHCVDRSVIGWLIACNSFSICGFFSKYAWYAFWACSTRLFRDIRQLLIGLRMRRQVRRPYPPTPCSPWSRCHSACSWWWWWCRVLRRRPAPRWPPTPRPTDPGEHAVEAASHGRCGHGASNHSFGLRLFVASPWPSRRWRY